MIDYNLVDREIVSALKTLPEIEVKTIIECGYPQNAADEVLVNEGTVEQKRLLLTGDKRTITRKKYKPCTHGGVIVLKHRRPDAVRVLAAIRSFIESGGGNIARNHFTHLRPDGAKTYTLQNPEIPVEVRF